uniref:Uncharacterized protein n=1 Tax=Sphaerodactylus townsendi TaxID=933632 RepID=A0ACB8F4I1_9SAUR
MGPASQSDCDPLNDEVSGFNGTITHCRPDTILYNASGCICEKEYRMVTFVGTDECICETISSWTYPQGSAKHHFNSSWIEIPYHCQSNIFRENDNVMKCLNATEQSSLGHSSSFYCLVVGSTLSLLSSACETDNQTSSLKDTAESFEKLVNNSLWNIEVKEEVVSAVMLVVESLGSTAVKTALSSPETPIQTVTTKSVADLEAFTLVLLQLKPWVVG